MIVCTECGHRNQDGDDFCGSCGAFLEFSGERTAAEVAEVSADPEPESDERATIVERVKAAVGLGDQGDDRPSVPTDESTSAASMGASAQVDSEAEANAEAAELRRRSEEEAQRRAQEAQRLAEEAAAAAQAAREAAEAEARRADEAEARQAAERAAREDAERAVAEAQEQVRRAAEEAEQAAAERAAAEEAERIRAEGAQAVEAEREAAAAAAQASAEAELARRAEAEAAAREAAAEEARQREEAEAREAAERRAREEAEAARRQAEEQAAAAAAALEEAERRAREAEQAARMAALVAKSKPAEPAPAQSVPEVPATSTEPTPDPTADVAAPLAGARKPEAVKPQRQRVKRVTAETAPQEVLNPGDLICGSCGVGNDPDRKFCRRCGSSLVAAAVAQKPAWYKRIFRRRPKAKPEAGTRPAKGSSGPGVVNRGKYAILRGRSVMGKIGRVAALLALLGVAGLSFGPWRDAVGDQIDKVKRIISPEYEPVRPASATASSELEGRPATAAIDQVSNSYWAEGAEGAGEGQGLTFTFSEPVDLDRIGFLNGASEDPKDFVTQPRVREVLVLFDDGTTKSLTLKDEADFQEFGISARQVTTVQLQIVSVHSSLEGSAASLAEVEFFRKE